LGLVVLFAAIIAFQAIYYFVFSAPETVGNRSGQHWMSLQSAMDSLNLKKKAEKPKIYPFNPNFITDFKGYKLGMSVAEIDRLLAFRKKDKYVNSAKEFQQVTKVSDSLLEAISPYFKFPDWVTQKNRNKNFEKFNTFKKKENRPVIDINLATKEDLKKIYGIGDGLSDRILKEKEKFGGFVSMEQMQDIWGLSPEVIEELTTSFSVKSIPEVKRINVNTASLKELMQFPYFRYALAKSIITHRSMNGKIADAAELTKISGFPVEKEKIITLYLEF